MGHLIIDQLFLESINTLDFINNLVISIRTTLIDSEAVKFVFCVFWVLFIIFFPLSIVPLCNFLFSLDLGGVCFFYLMLNITFFELNAE